MDQSETYYDASRSAFPRFPALQEKVCVDVAIVGAGFTGLASAICLADRGYRVALLEQGRVGDGASGRNGGQLIGGMAGEPGSTQNLTQADQRAILDLSYRGHSIIRDWVKRFSIDCDLRWGYADVAINARQARLLGAKYERLSRLGFSSDLELVDRKDVPSLLGTERYCRALINRRDGHLHPLNLCVGEAAVAHRLGVLVYEGTLVTGLHPGTSFERSIVETELGSVEADSVILATNAYQSLPMPRLRTQMYRARSHMLATEPLSQTDIATINPQLLAVSDLRADEDYFRISADGRLLFGALLDYSANDRKSSVDRLLPRLRAVYPALAEKQIDYAWSGWMAMVRSGVPLIGTEGSRIYYAAGFSGHGVSMTHACGELLADAVAGRLEGVELLAKVPRRNLPFGGVLGENAVFSPVSLYHRLRQWAM